MTEHEEQCLFVQWMEAQFPKIRFFAVPNGGQRNIITATKLKREGVRSGVPDVYVPKWKLWIEMKKAKGGTLSKTQKDWIDYLVNDVGDTVIVARGFSDAKIQVIEFLDKM
jgi:hypothetical protein